MTVPRSKCWSVAEALVDAGFSVSIHGRARSHGRMGVVEGWDEYWTMTADSSGPLDRDELTKFFDLLDVAGLEAHTSPAGRGFFIQEQRAKR
jgi:hypothetical protein